jgi:hypothetical protein
MRGRKHFQVDALRNKRSAKRLEFPRPCHSNQIQSITELAASSKGLAALPDFWPCLVRSGSKSERPLTPFMSGSTSSGRAVAWARKKLTRSGHAANSRRYRDHRFIHCGSGMPVVNLCKKSAKTGREQMQQTTRLFDNIKSTVGAIAQHAPLGATVP